MFWLWAVSVNAIYFFVLRLFRDTELDGDWEAPNIPNPAYKGEWHPKKIPNPAYKGAWEHPQIDVCLHTTVICNTCLTSLPMQNPEYADDDSLYQYKSNKYVGFEIWQVKSGTIFDDILVTDDVAAAEKAAEAFATKAAAEKSAFETAKEAERKKAEEEAAKAEAEAEAAAGDDEEEDADADEEDVHDEL
jgi:calreticulin